ncbi:sigma-70 family RNA polymerase sigma factor [Paraglaciecola sp. 2405UD69-4]|uniref:sigma-70 family RNA polymerase sigma factor n=1 Tax=Paraglaciecola sp. 2405UD69-4 TaxID=3391836 RepID=UPI0039C9D04C
MLATNQRAHSVNMTISPQKQGMNTKHPELCIWLHDIAIERDKRAFSELFKWFAPRIKQFGIKQFNNEAQALELVQETMTNIWRKAHLYHADKGAPTTWMYSIMRNMSFDMLRKIQTQRTESISDDIWPVDNILVSDDIDNFEDHLESRNIKSLLDHLPEKQKQVVVGLFYKQVTQEQLAQQLNLPIGTVKSRLRLALNKLRQLMGDSDD